MSTQQLLPLTHLTPGPPQFYYFFDFLIEQKIKIVKEQARRENKQQVGIIPGPHAQQCSCESAVVAFVRRSFQKEVTSKTTGLEGKPPQVPSATASPCAHQSRAKLNRTGIGLGLELELGSDQDTTKQKQSGGNGDSGNVKSHLLLPICSAPSHSHPTPVLVLVQANSFKSTRLVQC